MRETKKYFDNEQLRLESISEEYRKDANKIICELPKHLILTSTVFIALSSSILGINEIIKNLSILEKWFLVIGLGLMVISIFMGLLQYLSDFLFFKRQVNTKEKIIESISNNKFNSEKDYIEEVNNISKDIKLESSNCSLILQCVFLLIGITSFFIMICKFLF